MILAVASHDDAASIAKVHIRAWRAAYGHILDRDWLAGLSIEARATRWQGILTASDSQNVVAKMNGNVVGFASFGNCRDEGAPSDQGELWALYVEPDAWGHGVGRALLDHAVTNLQREGFRSTSLWVLVENHRGIAFYEACGFSRIHGSEKQFELGNRTVEEVRFVRRNDV
jgi:ribosomal protein S18 acetylase RimI-like enzyme